MGLTSALNTSLNGLVLNETTIDVLGNNIANAGTNGFKASNVLFTTQLARTLGVGSRPTATNGGTNPRQIGLGALTAAIRKDFTQGSVTNSTSPSDLAIQGDGFFIMDGPEGGVYTRDGTFTLNSGSLLVNSQGLRVQGYGVDQNFNLITTQLSDIYIPLGDLNVAQQTQNVAMSGALLPTGELGAPGAGATLTSMVLYSDAAGTTAATGGTALTSVFYESSPGVFAALFTAGETLSFGGEKGGRRLEAQELAVTGSDVNDLLTTMDHVLGIHAVGGAGVSINGNGEIVVQGNAGSVNDLILTVGDLTSNNGATNSTIPLTFAKSESAVGESAITDFVVYDSLGQAVTVKMSAVLEARDSTSTTFRYFLESFDDSSNDTAVMTGTIVFDSHGQVTSGGTQSFSINRDNTAAVSPMVITADFSGLSGISSEAAGSTLSLSNQDGSSPGTLTSFVIDETGIINGVFDNGIIRTLGQVTLARFANPQGLLEAGSGVFREGVSSGPPFIATPGNFGAGTIRAGAIELSNTDVGRNLVDLIVASTNYRGNARVISSVQQLVDELLVLGR